MAEFTEVCRQALRMAKAEGEKNALHIEYVSLCISADGKVRLEDGRDTGTAEEVESFVMKWASEHPESKYPTWGQWTKDNFPEGVRPICLLNFMGREACTEFECCEECRAQPIPADIAEKLGVKPIGSENNG